jgi:glycosyltransferase involved in cell wall biosynthesis
LFRIRIFLHQFGANYSGFYESLSPFLKKRLVKMLSKADKIIVEGDYTKNQFSFMKDYLDKVAAIPNGLPGKDIEVEYECKTYDVAQPFNMIYLSNMIESKGYLDVLMAVNLLVNVHQRNVHCVFAGKFIATADTQQDPKKARKCFLKTT